MTISKRLVKRYQQKYQQKFNREISSKDAERELYDLKELVKLIKSSRKERHVK